MIEIASPERQSISGGNPKKSSVNSMEKSFNDTNAAWVGRAVKKATPALCDLKQAERRTQGIIHGNDVTVSNSLKSLTAILSAKDKKLLVPRELPKENFMYGCQKRTRSFSSVKGLNIHSKSCQND